MKSPSKSGRSCSRRAIIASGQIARDQRNRDCVGKMKQFASWFTHGVPGGSTCANRSSIPKMALRSSMPSSNSSNETSGRGSKRRSYTRLRMQKLAKMPRWATCLAISLLTGLGTGILALAISSFFFYRHYASQFPDDTQNLLSALTSSVLVGIGVFVVASVARLRFILCSACAAPSIEPVKI